MVIQGTYAYSKEIKLAQQCNCGFLINVVTVRNKAIKHKKENKKKKKKEKRKTKPP